ncbi:type II toxin-antitoxin system HicB family antitoxin [Mitsuokella multacida]|uniref:type II toxin-antitoxin system HicB family antitoxin n=1 Tax=Mitsuokella multacida TaxID=52226 RepID=UPI00266DAD65|nr:type II toxin-antitoxin system HicB family antitoxin [Mitsuokella multacida]
MEMTKLSYPAVFHPEENGGYSVDFPDLLGCVTEGDTFSEVVDMAEDALGIYLYSLKEDGEPYPKPSKPAGIKAEGRDFVSLIEYDEAAYLKCTDERP